MLTPYTIEKFGGLTLRDDPFEAGAGRALDLLNVTLARNGRVSTRDGYSLPYSGASFAITNMYGQTGEILLASLSGNSVKVIDLTAGTASASTAITSQISSFAGAGTTGAVYFTDGASAQVQKWSGAAFSSPAGLALYKGNFLAVQPLDDRLVIADASNTGRIWFSDQATPETIGVNNYVGFTLGDLEPITGMEVYAEQLYVFKKTKFFVFYGNSVDPDGEPVFNKRMVDTGIGCWQDAGDYRKLTASHPTGLYFVGQDGVYRTTGGPPVRVSDDIAPLFKGANLEIPSDFLLDTVPTSRWGCLGVAADKLYLSTLSGNGTYMLDLTTGQWSAHSIGAFGRISSVLDGADVAVATDTSGYRGGTLFGLAGEIGLSNDAKTTDNGAAIPWHWTSGRYALAEGRRVHTHYSSVTGTGTASLLVATDLYDAATADAGYSVATATALTLGTTRTAEAYDGGGNLGQWYQHTLSGSGVASVNRVAHYVTSVR